ncbi:protein EFR3 B-like protein, partial [Leptotrombidium deliense]
CCRCCSALRSRYKRLVDNIFPANPEDGLVKNNMEKLKFYTVSSPEKLDRIGEYLAQKVARDLSRHRVGYVIIAMDAMDQLLIACHSQSLNLFVESFLKVVQQLLESQDPNMQLLATQSFIKFANIEEDTPSYHRRYDFFVSKFSSLCHNSSNDMKTRKMLRLAGLNGLKGVIRKTVSDDLQVDIWDEIHMGKIIPSLIYNMQDQEVISMSDNVDASPVPCVVAEECLRELIAKATFGNIRSVIRPVLKHLDNHNLWVATYPDEFATHTFKLIMHSIQSQHSYAVIQLLMGHLDEKCKFRPKPADGSEGNSRVRTGIVNVLSSIIAIAAAESIGPSVLEIINSLLNHLRNSIHNCREDSKNTEDERLFQETVINTLGEFANNLPDFQKIEIIMFIISKVPPTSARSQADILLQDILLKSLLKVSTKYRTVNMSQAFPNLFLTPLLKMSLATDPNVRLTVQRIFQQLLDRHNNLPKLSVPISTQPLPALMMEKAYRQDLMFMKKHGTELLCHMYQNVQFENNTEDNYNAIYTTLALLCVEMSSEESLTDLLRLQFAIQDLAFSGTLSDSQNIAIHCLLASFYHLIAQLTAIPSLCSHVEQVIKSREERAPYLLPEFSELNCTETVPETDEELFFNKTTIIESLRSSGHDITRITTPLITGTVVDAGMARSISDLKSVEVEVDSVNSSPGTGKKHHPEEGIDFQSFRRILTEPFAEEKDVRDERRAQIIEMFKKAPFEDLVLKSERKVSEFPCRLNEVFCKLRSIVYENDEVEIGSTQLNPANKVVSRSPFNQVCNIVVNSKGPPLYSIQFPDLFVY